VRLGLGWAGSAAKRCITRACADVPGFFVIGRGPPSDHPGHIPERLVSKVLAEPEQAAEGAGRPPVTGVQVEMLTGATGAVTAVSGGAAAAAAGLGPIGLGAAAVGAIPSIISLFSSTTTVRDHTENITDLATTTSVVAAVAKDLGTYTVVHEDFRLAPEESPIRKRYQDLMDMRTALIFKQEQVHGKGRPAARASRTLVEPMAPDLLSDSPAYALPVAAVHLLTEFAPLRVAVSALQSVAQVRRDLGDVFTATCAIKTSNGFLETVYGTLPTWRTGAS
jgi:hypothetical protein